MKKTHRSAVKKKPEKQPENRKERKQIDSQIEVEEKKIKRKKGTKKMRGAKETELRGEKRCMEEFKKGDRIKQEDTNSMLMPKT